MEPFIEVRTRGCRADPAVLWSVVEAIGGGLDRWHSPAWAWRVRTRIDAHLGGVGRGPGRRDPDSLVPAMPSTAGRMTDWTSPTGARRR